MPTSLPCPLSKKHLEDVHHQKPNCISAPYAGMPTSLPPPALRRTETSSGCTPLKTKMYLTLAPHMPVFCTEMVSRCFSLKNFNKDLICLFIQTNCYEILNHPHYIEKIPSLIIYFRHLIKLYILHYFLRISKHLHYRAVSSVDNKISSSDGYCALTSVNKMLSSWRIVLSSVDNEIS